METAKDYSDLHITFNALQDDTETANRFSRYISRQYSNSKVTVQTGSPPLSVSVNGLTEKECRSVKYQLRLQAYIFCRFERLTWVIADIDAKHKISRRLLEEARDNYDGLKFATTFFRCAIDALRLDVVVSLAALYERPKLRRRTVSIPGLVEFVKKH